MFARDSSGRASEHRARSVNPEGGATDPESMDLQDRDPCFCRDSHEQPPAKSGNQHLTRIGAVALMGARHCFLPEAPVSKNPPPTP